MDSAEQHAQDDVTREEMLARQRELGARLRAEAGEPAPRGVRVAAFALDLVAWMAGLLLPTLLNLVLIEWFGGDPEGPMAVPGSVVSLVVFFGYPLIGTFLWGATPGKLVFRLRVISYTTGSPVSPWHAWGRFLLHGVFAVFCWGVMFLVDHLWFLGEARRTVHDIVAGTCVVRLPEGPGA